MFKHSLDFASPPPLLGTPRVVRSGRQTVSQVAFLAWRNRHTTALEGESHRGPTWGSPWGCFVSGQLGTLGTALSRSVLPAANGGQWRPTRQISGSRWPLVSHFIFMPHGKPLFSACDGASDPVTDPRGRRKAAVFTDERKRLCSLTRPSLFPLLALFLFHPSSAARTASTARAGPFSVSFPFQLQMVSAWRRCDAKRIRKGVTSSSYIRRRARTS